MVLEEVLRLRSETVPRVPLIGSIAPRREKSFPVS